MPLKSEQFAVSTLPNGLTVLTYNMPHVQSVAINLIVMVGSRYETISEMGISHFLEHMAFKGTETRTARDIAEEFDAIGGHFNAYTSREQTVYYAKTLKSDCYNAMEILADIIQNSAFKQEDIEKEHQVILQEIAGVYDNPDELVYEKFYEVAYQNQPLGRSILGDKKTIAKFNGDSFSAYLAKHYNAGNMYLSVAGNVQHDEILSYAAKLFSSLKNEKRDTFAKAQYFGGCNAITKDLEQTNIVLGFESVPYSNTQQFYHAQMMSLILGGGISSRLFQQIRENLGLAYSVGAYNSAYYDSGLFSIFVSTNHDKVKLLADSLIIEIKKLVDNVEDAELERAKAQVKASIYMAEEKSSYKSEEIGKNFAIFGKYMPLNEIMSDISATSKNDIIKMARQVFASKPTVSIAGPRPKDLDYSKMCEELSS